METPQRTIPPYFIGEVVTWFDTRTEKTTQGNALRERFGNGPFTVTDCIDADTGKRCTDQTRNYLIEIDHEAQVHPNLLVYLNDPLTEEFGEHVFQDIHSESSP